MWVFVWLHLAVLSKIRKRKNVINIDCDTVHIFTMILADNTWIESQDEKIQINFQAGGQNSKWHIDMANVNIRFQYLIKVH